MLGAAVPFAHSSETESEPLLWLIPLLLVSFGTALYAVGVLAYRPVVRKGQTPARQPLILLTVVGIADGPDRGPDLLERELLGQPQRRVLTGFRSSMPRSTR